MVALKWNNTGERFFETGVDRGVLYVNDRPGVPWNGLVGVSQSPTGGEPTPYYNDGLKFINLTTAEEFEATLEALSSPYEFDECDGTGTLGNGLFVTQQIRKQFHLSYRTRVGNDVDGVDHGYKIHLVYNALAGPSPRSYTTLNDSPEAMTLSWGITTIPAIAEGFKPTAHYVIDSRRTPKALLRYFESMLYGDEENQPTMPSAQEVTTLFTSQGPLYRTNQHPVPRANSNSKYLPMVGDSYSGASSAGLTVVATWETGVEGIPIFGIDTMYSRTFTGSTAPGTSDFAFTYAVSNFNPLGTDTVIPAGTRVTFGYLCKTDWVNPGGRSTLRVTPHTRVNGTFGIWGANGTLTDLGDGWYWGTTTILPNGTTDTRVGTAFGHQFTNTNLQEFPFTFSVTAVMVISGKDGEIPTSLSMEDYFDGDFENDAYNTYAWSGVAHKSPSTLYSWGEI